MIIIDCLAHRRNETDKKEQLLITHLKNTAELCSEFAKCVNLKEYGYYIGMMHDIGKYSDSFQKRIRGSSIKVQHSLSGAKEAYNLRLPMAAFCISGHHGGLPDIGTRGDDGDDATFCGKMSRRLEDYSYWSKEQNEYKTGQITEPCCSNGIDYAFLTKVMFSCLVDADFLDTESFMSDSVNRLKGDSIEVLLERLNEYILKWNKPVKKLNKLRTDMLNECVSCGKESNEKLFTLTVPTGGGKTVSSLAFALNYAKRKNKKRIIYVIPYTSIIEQNAGVFRSILGSSNVIENHCNVDLSSDKNDELRTKKTLASENWDAPVIVTTAVQFFESIYSARPSKCRKIHNIADSVIIFDEAQMIPVPYLLPCVSAIWELTQMCNCAAVLCTATQPNLDGFFNYLRGEKSDYAISEICISAKDVTDDFRRADFSFDGKLDDDEIAARLNECRQVLCIVNKKAHSKKLFAMLQNSDGNFDLSTHMYPAHRKAVIAEIKKRLEQDKPCRVVSTSLIEAGVDIDFPVVYRAIAGIDSVLQAGGRCNRENKHSRKESIVHIFDTEFVVPYQQINVDVARKIFDEYGSEIYKPEAVKKYFDSLYYYKNSDKSFTVFDKNGILKNLEKFNFDTVSSDFKLIDNNTKTLYIPTEGNKNEISYLRSGKYNKELFRILQNYAVNLYDLEFSKLDNVGAIEKVDNDFYILASDKYYDKDTGVVIPEEKLGSGIFL